MRFIGHCDAALPWGTMSQMLQGQLPHSIFQEPQRPAPRIVRHGHWPVPHLSSFLVPESLWPQHQLDPTHAADRHLVYQSLLGDRPSYTEAWERLSHTVCYLLPQVRIRSLSVLRPVEWRGQVTTTGSTRTAALRVPTPKGQPLDTSWTNLPSGVLVTRMLLGLPYLMKPFASLVFKKTSYYGNF